MATANAQLQTALASFSSQPGVTPDQEAQLRTALSADQDLVERLNQQAASGHLNGFTLSPSGADSLIGSYDKSSGIVTLPALQAGPAAATDLRAALRLQEMSMRFAHSTYIDGHNKARP